MGCSMEKQEQQEAKKVFIEFNKAFVQTRRNVIGDEFFSKIGRASCRERV